MNSFAIIARPVVTVWGTASESRQNSEGEVVSEISDENLYGCVCRVLERDDSWLRVMSHYGYTGYVKCDDVRLVSEEEARTWLSGSLRMVDARFLDVLSLPSVHGVRLLTLSGGSVVDYIPDPDAEAEGYAHVRLCDGREGFVYFCHLAEKKFGEPFLWCDPVPVIEKQLHAGERSCTARGGDSSFSFSCLLDRFYGGSESLFRKQLVEEAGKYIGAQYRWGGRSGYGIDCSGLVSMAYMRCGVNIYRDASIVDGWPLERIDLCWDENGIFDLQNLENGTVRMGDALFFPGHVALYIGDGKYIHSTGRVGSCGCVFNSLLPDSPDFREDLLKGLYAVGGLR